MSNSFDPVQAKGFFRNNLGPSCLQRLSEEIIISYKYYMLQSKLDLELECSLMLDIYLRLCFEIVFEIFHVMGRRPLFQINYID